MSKEQVFVLFPVGRYVGGSIDKGRDVIKNGVAVKNDDGTAAKDFSFGVAYDKTPGRDWKDEPWGQQIVAKAQQDFPQGQWQHPQFSWKVTDGDSTVPNKKGKRPADNEHYRGKWVVWFSSRFPAVTKDAKGRADVPADSIKPGHYVEVYGSVRGNTGDSPGVYVNHVAVAHSGGYGMEITFAPDLSEVGFGQAALPPGVSAVPQSQMTPPASNPQPPAATPTPTPPYTGAMTPPAPDPQLQLGQSAIASGAKTVADVLAWPGWTEETLLAYGHLIRA